MKCCTKRSGGINSHCCLLFCAWDYTMLTFCTNICIESVSCFVRILFWSRELNICEIPCISQREDEGLVLKDHRHNGGSLEAAGDLIGSSRVRIQKADSGCCHCHLSLVRKTQGSYSYILMSHPYSLGNQMQVLNFFSVLWCHSSEQFDKYT